MWNAKELQVSKLIEAQDLLLPRFQRKSTWGPRKDFLLALSFFKGLPLGAIVIKEAGSEGGGSRYLLDGRQRWEALKGIQDPETVYSWAKQALGIRAGWSEQQVVTAYRRAVENYFGTDPSDDPEDPELAYAQSDADGSDSEADTEPEEDMVVESQDEVVASTDGESSSPGLDELLEIILLVHPQTTKGSKLTKAFAVQDLVGGLPYVEVDRATHKATVSGRKLREWITFRRKIASPATSQGVPNESQFIDWLTNGDDPNDDALDALRNRVSTRWGTIHAAIDLNRRIERRLEQTVIAALVLTGTKASEDAKIFEIINTGGTKLTAAEVLSASPQWSALVVEPNSKLVADAADLYTAMGIQAAEGAVRWDVAATLLSRLSLPDILGSLTGNTPRNDTRRFERRITLGFQLMAGWYQGKIAKDFVETLPRTNPEISWGTTAFEDLLNSASRIAMLQDQFQYWHQWGLSLIDMTSDAVALNFVLSTATDWDRKGRPTADGAEMKAFRRNARTLLDRAIYEYSIGNWRGSSDSRIANNLGLLRSSPDAAYEPVSPEDWIRLVDEVVESGTIGGVDYTSRLDPRIKLLVSYRNVIDRMWPEAGPEIGAEYDHIIPSSEFRGIPGSSPKKRMEHHIINIGMLPPALNRSKSDERLDRIQSQADCEKIAKLEGIPLESFSDFSSAEAALDLAAWRGPSLKEALTVTRQHRLEVA